MRAVLVSFAGYHLWLDWRKTGYHLASLFTDYEPDIHTLRIYNPIKQSHEHDKTGGFIRKCFLELIYVTNTWINGPFEMNLSMQKDMNCIIGEGYPYPIVDHTQALKPARAKIAAVQKKGRV
jgi:deoxyribodipyrimidine photo-lyase